MLDDIFADCRGVSACRIQTVCTPYCLQEEGRVVVMRFGHDWDETCMQMDEILSSVADKMKNFAVIYLVDISEVPDFNAMYELYDPCTVMFFFRNKVSRRAAAAAMLAGRGSKGWRVAAPTSKGTRVWVGGNMEQPCRCSCGG